MTVTFRPWLVWDTVNCSQCLKRIRLGSEVGERSPQADLICFRNSWELISGVSCSGGCEPRELWGHPGLPGLSCWAMRPANGRALWFTGNHGYPLRRIWMRELTLRKSLLVVRYRYHDGLNFFSHNWFPDLRYPLERDHYNPCLCWKNSYFYDFCIHVAPGEVTAPATKIVID